MIPKIKYCSNPNPDSNETVEEMKSIKNERTRDWDDQYICLVLPEDGETEGEITQHTWNFFLLNSKYAEGLLVRL